MSKEPKSSVVVFPTTPLTPCLIVSGQEESFSDKQKDCVEKMGFIKSLLGVFEKGCCM